MTNTTKPRTTAYRDPVTKRSVYVGEGAVRQQGEKKLYECNECGREVVWLESKRTGKVYLASVYRGEVVRYYVSKPHVCRKPEPLVERPDCPGATAHVTAACAETGAVMGSKDNAPETLENLWRVLARIMDECGCTTNTRPA